MNPTDEPKKTSGTILLVEDDEFLRDLLIQKLETKGYTVEAGKDGETAYAMAAAHQPDLMLLDIYLPGMSGFELVRKLRQKEETAHIPFVVLSNSAENQSQKEAEELGAEAYLVKAQTTPVHIVEAIDTWFSAR